MKDNGLTMAQCIGASDLWYHIDILYCEKNWLYPPTASGTASGSYGR